MEKFSQPLRLQCALFRGLPAFSYVNMESQKPGAHISLPLHSPTLKSLARFRGPFHKAVRKGRERMELG